MEKKYLKKNYGSVNQSDLYSRNRHDEEIHTLHTSHLQYLEDKDAFYIQYVLVSHSTHSEHIDRQNGHKDEASWGNPTGEREREEVNFILMETRGTVNTLRRKIGGMTFTSRMTLLEASRENERKRRVHTVYRY